MIENRRLTTRELQMLGMAANGMRDQAIAKATGLSPFTVNVMFDKAAQRLGTSTRPRAVIAAFESQQLDLDSFVNDDDLAKINLLTHRQREVLFSMHKKLGSKNREKAIGEELEIKSGTVRNHKQAMYRTVGAGSQTRAVVLGYAAELRGMTF